MSSTPLLIYTLLIWCRDVAVPTLEEITGQELEGKEFLTLSIFQIDSYLREHHPEVMGAVEQPPVPPIQFLSEMDLPQEFRSQFPEGEGPAEPSPAPSEPQASTLEPETSSPETPVPAEVASPAPGSESGTPRSEDSAAGVPVPGKPDHGRMNSSAPVARRASTDAPKPIVTG